MHHRERLSPRDACPPGSGLGRVRTPDMTSQSLVLSFPVRKSYGWQQSERRLQKGSEVQTPESARNAERGRCRVRQTREIANMHSTLANRTPTPTSPKGSKKPERPLALVCCNPTSVDRERNPCRGSRRREPPLAGPSLPAPQRAGRAIGSTHLNRLIEPSAAVEDLEAQAIFTSLKRMEGAANR